MTQTDPVNRCGIQWKTNFVTHNSSCKIFCIEISNNNPNLAICRCRSSLMKLRIASTFSWVTAVFGAPTRNCRLMAVVHSRNENQLSQALLPLTIIARKCYWLNYIFPTTCQPPWSYNIISIGLRLWIWINQKLRIFFLVTFGIFMQRLKYSSRIFYVS